MEKNNPFFKELNFEYFEQPPSKIKSSLTALKFSLSKVQIYTANPNLFLCNKTTDYDKLLVASTISGNYLFLKDEIIRKLYIGALSAKEYQDLLKNIALLKSNGYSLVVFPEKDYSVFGNVQHIPLSITNFLFNTGYDLHFLYLVGTYFASPIWSPTHRRCDTKCVKQISYPHSKLEELLPEEQNEVINKGMPSSSATYAEKNHVFMRSNKLAEYIERIIYCCPTCKDFFNIYSEFNCLKCKNCGSAIEFSNNGKIEFTKDIYSFDYIDEFLFEQLKQLPVDNTKLFVKYDSVKMHNTEDKKPEWLDNIELSIYFGEIHVKVDGKTKKYMIANFEDIELLPSNILNIYLKNETLTFKGETTENFYILLHLYKLLKTVL